MVNLFVLQERSTSIATYALCGFSSLSTIAISIGVWQAVCPQRVGDMANQLLRVAINANISCLLTACVAGKSAKYSGIITGEGWGWNHWGGGLRIVYSSEGMPKSCESSEQVNQISELLFIKTTKIAEISLYKR